MAHILGDFTFQGAATVESKRRLEWQGYLKHALLLLSLSWTFLAVLTDVDAGSLRAIGIVFGLIVLHTMSDVAKNLADRRRKMPSPLLFLADQVWHLTTIAAAVWGLAGWSGSALAGFVRAIPHSQPKALPILTIYAAALFGGGQLIRSLTKPLLDDFSELHTGEAASFRQLKNAGLYIGWLERFLVISALALQSPATIGLILTAKSIVRFPELKDLRFAEYFLIGTLLSISVALVGGICVIWILFGTLSLK